MRAHSQRESMEGRGPGLRAWRSGRRKGSWVHGCARGVRGCARGAHGIGRTMRAHSYSHLWLAGGQREDKLVQGWREWLKARYCRVGADGTKERRRCGWDRGRRVGVVVVVVKAPRVLGWSTRQSRAAGRSVRGVAHGSGRCVRIRIRVCRGRQGARREGADQPRKMAGMYEGMKPGMKAREACTGPRREA